MVKIWPNGSNNQPNSGQKLIDINETNFQHVINDLVGAKWHYQLVAFAVRIPLYSVYNSMCMKRIETERVQNIPFNCGKDSC